MPKPIDPKGPGLMHGHTFRRMTRREKLETWFQLKLIYFRRWLRSFDWHE